MANLIVKLLLEDKDFAAKFKKNKEAVLSFSNVGSSMLGVVGKFAGAFGLAMGGVEAFNKAMQSSQTLADSYGGVMHAAKESVDNFFYSLTSGDFSSFLGGLDAMISRAREAYAVLDDFGNVQMSFNYSNAQDLAKLQDLLNQARDTSASQGDRQAALEQAKALQQSMAANAAEYKTSAMATIRAEIKSGQGVINSDIFTNEMIDKMLRLDASANRGEAREKYAAAYKEYLEKYNAATKTTEDITSAGGVFGSNTTTVPTAEYVGLSEAEVEAKVNEKVLALQEQYAEAIAYNALLEKASDERLNQYGQRVIATENAIRAIEAQVRTLQRVEGGIQDKKGGSTSNEVQTPQHNPELADSFSRLGNISSGFTGIADFFAQDEQDKAMKKAREDKRLKDLGIPEQLGEIEVPDVPDIDDKKKGLEDYSSAVGSLSSAFGTLGGAIGGTEGALLSWLGTSIQAVASIATTIAQLTAESTAYTAEATAATQAAGAKALEAHSGIPFVGVAMGAAAVATIIATMMSMPKFAEGGVVTGPTVGLVGEAGPEAIIPLAKLEKMMAGNSREVRVVGTLRARGKDLVGTIENFNNVKNVR